FKCTLDNKDVACAPNKTLKYTVGERLSGTGELLTHSFVATIDYKTKGTSSAGTNWVTDFHRPVVTVVTKPAAVIYNNRATFKFAVSDNSGASNVNLICVLDSKELDCPMNQDIVLNAMSSGDHVLMVHGVDKAGNAIASNIEIKWNSPSCSGTELSLRWPMNGKEFSNWGVMSYYDYDAEMGQRRDSAGQLGLKAKVSDNHFGISMFPGDHKQIYTYNSSGVKNGNAAGAAVVAMESGEVISVEESLTDKILDTAGILVCRIANPGSGNNVKIRHKNGFVSQYYYLSQNSVPDGIVKGANVVRGQIIGYAGSSSCMSQPQLTVTLKNCTGDTLDPLKFPVTHEDGSEHEYKATHSGAVSARIMGLIAHNGSFSSSASSLKDILNRAKQNTVSNKLSRDSTVTLSYFLGNVTDDVTEIQYAMIPPGKDGDHTAYKYYPEHGQPGIKISHSTGRVVRANIGKFNVAGNWKVKIYHLRTGDVCKTKLQKDNNCTLVNGTVDVFVKP
ncbi:MAG: M23 family metallopeptidase, partial [Bdellovibrionaceae bacterium]|nr:M23 family metallopeptidase [Pseudobdellovibrionaceae bacterium]